MSANTQALLLAVATVSLVGCTDAAVDAPPVETPPVTLACAAPTHGPTIHQGDVADGEVWRADEGPHLVKSDVRVRNGARLVIEACSTVELSPRASIDVAFPGTPGKGTLLAEGTADKPIVFRRAAAEPWGHLLVHAPGSARLAHVTLEGGGAVDPDGVTVLLHGDGALPSDPTLFVDHVTVKGSKGLGVRADRGARFVDGSDALTVVGSGARPVQLGELGLVAFPRGSYVGNAVDELQITPETGVLESATVKAVGVPWHAGVPGAASLVVGGRTDKALVTLTLEAGVHLRMQKGGALELERATGPFPASGALVAVGTAASPIVLSSDQASPQPGDWRGLWFGGVARAENRVEHVRLEHTGADCGCVLVTCSAGVTGYQGAVIFTQEPPSVFVKDSSVVAGKGHGFVLGYTGAPLDFAGQNTVSVAECAQTMPSAASCPVPRPACK